MAAIRARRYLPDAYPIVVDGSVDEVLGVRLVREMTSDKGDLILHRERLPAGIFDLRTAVAIGSWRDDDDCAHAGQPFRQP